MLTGLILGLSSCTNKTNQVEQSTEKLHSFFIVDNKLYAVGTLYDYQFEGVLVRELNRFLTTPLTNKINMMEVRFEVKEAPKVQGSYYIELAQEGLSEKELDQLVREFGFYIGHDNVRKNYSADGQLVRLADRDDILQKFRFKQPLEADFIRYETVNTFDKDTAVSVIKLPLTVAKTVIELPVRTFWLMGCATYGC